MSEITTPVTSWKGNVSLRTGMFAKSAYAVIDSTGITVHKNASEESEVLYRIVPSEISQIVASKGDFSEMMWKGYQGYQITYDKEGKQDILRFWPKGFGQYPNSKEVKPFGEALAAMKGLNPEELTKGAVQGSQDMIVAFAVILPAIIMCGALPGALIALSVFGAMGLWKNEKMDETLRKVLAVLLVVGAVGFAAVLNVVVGVWRAQN